VLQRYNIQDV